MTGSNMYLGYRKDIQALRGIAVSMVVLYHLELPGFTGGFLGVDAFFVISGYLMAAMYDPDAKADFFRKRARRLLPAYFVTTATTLLVAIFVVTPIDYHQTVEQAAFASLFLSNVGFWLQNSYFDKSAFKPLLHLWSLAVEIQFYVLVPVVAWALTKWRWNYLVLMGTSLLLCALVTGVSPKTSFFLLPFRLWEFILGFAVARWARQYSGLRSGVPSWVGPIAATVVAGSSFLRIDGNSLSFAAGHPGMAALLVCTATATVLLVGLPSNLMRSPLFGVLEKLGNYSYAIYLAHFPVIVLYLYSPFSGTVLRAGGFSQALVLLALIAVTSALLYRGVERPLRTGGRILMPSLAMVALIAGVSLLGVQVLRHTVPQQEMMVYDAWTDRDTYRCGKMHRIFEPFNPLCELAAGEGPASLRILLAGNSHADSIKKSFTDAAKDAGAALLFVVENNPLMPGGMDAQQLVDEARNQRIDAIVLHYSPGAIDAATVVRVQQLSARNGMRTAFLMPVPVWNAHVPRALLNHLRTGVPLAQKSLEDYLKYNAKLIEDLHRLAPQTSMVHATADVLCDPLCELVSLQGRPLYFDEGHLTLTGAALLEARFAALIATLRHERQPPAQP